MKTATPSFKRVERAAANTKQDVVRARACMTFDPPITDVMPSAQRNETETKLKQN